MPNALNFYIKKTLVTQVKNTKAKDLAKYVADVDSNEKENVYDKNTPR